jgi:hypothetical protein
MQDDFPESSPPFPVSCSRGFLGEEGEVGEVGSCATADVMMDPSIGTPQGTPRRSTRGPARAGFENKVQSSRAFARLPGVAFPWATDEAEIIATG